MDLRAIAEAATQPNVAVPITTTGAIATMVLEFIPTITMVGWAIYVVLVVSHKSWQMYREWRDDPTAPGKGWFR